MKQILVVGPRAVGDMVMASSFFQLLRAREPEVAIDVIATPGLMPLLELMREVRAGVALPDGHREWRLGARWRLARQLRDRRYDHAYVLPRSFKSALVPWLARIPVRTGLRAELRGPLLTDGRVLDPGRPFRPVDRVAALAAPVHDLDRSGRVLPGRLPAAPMPRLSVPADHAARARRLWRVPEDRPVVILAPGAEHRRRCWPPRHFAALATSVIDRGFTVLLLGAKADQDGGDALMAALSWSARARCVDAVGRTTLREAAALMVGAHAAVANDSGLLHVAAALGLPVLGLYGPSDPAHCPPLSPLGQTLSLPERAALAMLPATPDGHHPSLTGLAPARVLAAFEALAGPLTDWQADRTEACEPVLINPAVRPGRGQSAG